MGKIRFNISPSDVRGRSWRAPGTAELESVISYPIPYNLRSLLYLFLLRKKLPLGQGTAVITGAQPRGLCYRRR